MVMFNFDANRHQFETQKFYPFFKTELHNQGLSASAETPLSQSKLSESLILAQDERWRRV